MEVVFSLSVETNIVGEIIMTPPSHPTNDVQHWFKFDTPRLTIHHVRQTQHHSICHA